MRTSVFTATRLQFFYYNFDINFDFILTSNFDFDLEFCVAFAGRRLVRSLMQMTI